MNSLQSLTMVSKSSYVKILVLICLQNHSTTYYIDYELHGAVNEPVVMVADTLVV